ncbi:hypothetical protein CEXT_721271 [Caerostris extrusa]|uniref:Uncharacterized protein n=1 Tax=Caerostris extrusa TaxID=172846 RepID=A0AAV4QDT9_CAEEX|nr:hypothetical protein CEXT_721271 [Caerostris extrusa]
MDASERIGGYKPGISPGRGKGGVPLTQIYGLLTTAKSERKIILLLPHEHLPCDVPPSLSQSDGGARAIPGVGGEEEDRKVRRTVLPA